MNQKDFEYKIKQEQLPMVIDFWAPWCVPCKVTKPILDDLAKEYKGRVRFWAINADQHKALVQDLKILGIPTLMVCQDGEIIKRYTGAQSPNAYRQIFESLSTGGEVQLSLSRGERILRLVLGGLIALVSAFNHTWWMLGAGLLVMFLGFYDRCPVWQTIRRRFLHKKD